MCLTRIEIDYRDKPLKGIRIGYAIVEKRERKMYKAYWGDELELYKEGRWYTAEILYTSKRETKPNMPIGFHVLKNYSDAMQYGGQTCCLPYIIVKVQIKDIIAYGTQENGDERQCIYSCYVALKRKIIEEVK